MADLLMLSDPALSSLLWTCFSALTLIASAAMALAMLPWTDEQISAVDDEFRSLVCPPAHRATLRR